MSSYRPVQTILSAQEPFKVTRNPLESYHMLEAAAQGDLPRIAQLLESGVNVDTPDATGRTALHLGSAEGHLEIVQYLIKHGSAINAKDRGGRDAVQEAARNGQKEIIQILLHAGAEWTPKVISELEESVLTFAFLGYWKAMLKLINVGISPSCVDYQGNTPLHLAAQKGRCIVVENLLRLKVEPNMLNLRGETPLSIALSNGNIRLATILLEGGAYDSTGTKDPKESLDKSKKRSHPGLRCKSFAIIQTCPTPIARALLRKSSIKPLLRPMSSLFYCDIVGFTELSSRLTAAQVSQLLTILIKAFDRLAYLHGVQKVDVVGDAYIAAANFTEEQPEDHAARLARFAIAAVAAARAIPIDPDDDAAAAAAAAVGRLQLRVGMHSGPCKAIVVNRGAPKYTLIGKAACIAARMESSCAPGRIQCSAACARLIAKQGHDIGLRPRSVTRTCPRFLRFPRRLKQAFDVLWLTA